MRELRARVIEACWAGARGRRGSRGEAKLLLEKLRAQDDVSQGGPKL